MSTDAAPLTGNGINLVGLTIGNGVNGIKATEGGTLTTADAGIGINGGPFASHKVFLMTDGGLQNQMQISRVHIAVCQDDIFGQGGQGFNNKLNSNRVRAVRAF